VPDLHCTKSTQKMAAFFFIIVLLHLTAGFGWVLYKIAFQKNEPK
jgi:hypothetical protein